MRYISIFIVITIIAVNFYVLPAAAETMYVVDELVITLRQGMSNKHKILKTLKTGTALEVLEEVDSYLRVRTEDGTEGYVLRQYISSKLPCIVRSNKLETENSKLKQHNKELQITKNALESQLKSIEGKYTLELSGLTTKSSEVEQRLEAALNNERILSEKYDNLVKQAENVIKISKERKKFSKENKKLKLEIKELRKKK